MKEVHRPNYGLSHLGRILDLTHTIAEPEINVSFPYYKEEGSIIEVDWRLNPYIFGIDAQFSPLRLDIKDPNNPRDFNVKGVTLILDGREAISVKAKPGGTMPPDNSFDVPFLEALETAVAIQHKHGLCSPDAARVTYEPNATIFKPLDLWMPSEGVILDARPDEF